MRYAISLLYIERILLVWDPTYGRDFYYDKITGASSWTSPRFLLKRHLDQLESVKDGGINEVATRVWYMKRRSNDLDIDLNDRLVHIRKEVSSAVRILQNFARCILARNCFLRQANRVYRRVLDEDSGAYYYLNMRSYETSWNRPDVYLHPAEEPPILLVNAEYEEAFRSKRLLTNREKNPIELWNESNDLYEQQQNLVNLVS